MTRIKQQLSIIAFSLLFLPLGLSAQTSETCNSSANCRTITQNGSGMSLRTVKQGPGFGSYNTATNSTGAGNVYAGYFWANNTGSGGGGATLEARTSGTGIRGLFMTMDANTTGNGAQVLQRGTGAGFLVNMQNSSSNGIGFKMIQGGNGWSGHFAGGKGFYSDRMAIATTNTNSAYALAVGGDIVAERVLVRLENNWPDYVFADSYDLSDLEEVEQFIEKNKHLPHLPSAASLEESGEVDLGDIQSRLLRTIEELTLHVIEQGKEIEKLKTIDVR